MPLTDYDVITYSSGQGLKCCSGKVVNHLTDKGSTKTICGRETAGRFGWQRKYKHFSTMFGDCKRCAKKAGLDEPKKGEVNAAD